METLRTILKKLDAGSFDYFFKLNGNEEVMRLISGKALSRDEALQKFEQVIKINNENDDTGYFGICLKGKGDFIGYGKMVMTETDEAEIGYSFLPEYWGRGYASEISEKLVEHARNLGYIKSLIAIIDPENTASRKILIKSGFFLEKSCIIVIQAEKKSIMFPLFILPTMLMELSNCLMENIMTFNTSILLICLRTLARPSSRF